VGRRGAGPAATATGGSGGTLYVVATPIGNLGDVTLRALEILRSVPLVAAEDTRISRRLLDRYDIPARTVSYHAQSGPARERDLLEHLASGADLAIVTDAGTPGVSDPGEGLVAAWGAAGGRVVPVPGASSVLAAVAGAGIAGPRWAFEGFLPRGGRERRERLAAIGADGRGSVLFEAPGRLAATLRDLATACGPGRPGAVCRELTKLHETITRGSLGELAVLAADGGIPARGEVVVVVGWVAGGGKATVEGADAGEGAGEVAATAALERARAEVDALVARGVARGDAARRVSHATGIPRRALYAVGRSRAADPAGEPRERVEPGARDDPGGGGGEPAPVEDP
jgi:16S rRNA (cytidine1402-2'-O)-methyltransferase